MAATMITMKSSINFKTTIIYDNVIMNRGVKVNYPKKKPRIKLEDLGDVSEPERRSMYDVLQDNLRIANRMTFLHRIIYVGAHKLPSYEAAIDLFQGIINRCNETYCIEKLSGFLLYYNQYIVHMVEGDEDNLNKHLSYLLDKNASHSQYIGHTKLLIQVSNINQRFFENWVSHTGIPSKLLEKLDINGDLQYSGRCIYNCIKKLYSLMGAHAEDVGAPGAPVELDRKTIDLATVSSIESPVLSRLYASYSYSSNIDPLDRPSDGIVRDYKFSLPEYELLDFVIYSNFTMKLQEYYDLYGVVPMRDIYKDRVWPVPHDFIPYDVFEKPFDCIIELPKELRRKPTDLTPLKSSVSVTSFIGDTKSREVTDREFDEATSEVFKEENLVDAKDKEENNV